MFEVHYIHFTKSLVKRITMKSLFALVFFQLLYVYAEKTKNIIKDATGGMCYNVTVSVIVNNCCENVTDLRIYAFILGIGTIPTNTNYATVTSINKYIKSLNANEIIQFEGQATPGYIGNIMFTNESLSITTLERNVHMWGLRTTHGIDPPYTYSDYISPATYVLIIAPALGAADQYSTGPHPFTSVAQTDRNNVRSGILARAIGRSVRNVAVIGNSSVGFSANVNFFINPSWPHSHVEGTYYYKPPPAPSCDCYSRFTQDDQPISIGSSLTTNMCSLTTPTGTQLPITTVISDGFTPAFAGNNTNMRALVIHMLGFDADEAVHVHSSLRNILRKLPPGITTPTLTTPRPYSDLKNFDVVYVVSHDILGDRDWAPSYNIAGLPYLVYNARNIFMPCYPYPHTANDPTSLRAYATIVGIVNSEAKQSCGNISATVTSRMFIGAGSGGNLALAAVLWGFGSSALVLEPSETLQYAMNATPSSGACCSGEPCDVTMCCPYNTADWQSMCPYVQRLMPLRRIVFATTKGGGYISGPASPSFFSSGCPGANTTLGYYNATVVETLFEEQMPARAFHAAINRMLSHIFNKTGGIV